MRKVQELSDDQYAILLNYYFNYPNPSHNQKECIAREANTSIEQVTLFYESQRFGDNHVEENRFKDRDSDGAEVQKKPASRSIDDLSIEEANELLEIFGMNPRPSKKKIRDVATRYGLDENEVEDFFVEQPDVSECGEEPLSKVKPSTSEPVPGTSNNNIVKRCERVHSRRDQPPRHCTFRDEEEFEAVTTPFPRSIGHLSRWELSELMKVFEKTRYPSAEILGETATRFKVNKGDLEGWFATERIERSHLEVLKKIDARRKRKFNTEEQSECSQSETPQKQIKRSDSRTEIAQQFGQAFLSVLRKEIENKKKVEAKSNTVQYQEKTVPGTSSMRLRTFETETLMEIYSTVPSNKRERDELQKVRDKYQVSQKEINHPENMPSASGIQRKQALSKVLNKVLEEQKQKQQLEDMKKESEELKRRISLLEEQLRKAEEAKDRKKTPDDPKK